MHCSHRMTLKKGEVLLYILSPYVHSSVVSANEILSPALPYISLPGKKLMQPLRLAMTGEMSGPDVGQQLRLVALAQAEGISCVPLEARMAELQAFIEADE